MNVELDVANMRCADSPLVATQLDSTPEPIRRARRRRLPSAMSKSCLALRPSSTRSQALRGVRVARHRTQPRPTPSSRIFRDGDPRSQRRHRRWLRVSAPPTGGREAHRSQASAKGYRCSRRLSPSERRIPICENFLYSFKAGLTPWSPVLAVRPVLAALRSGRSSARGTKEVKCARSCCGVLAVQLDRSTLVAHRSRSMNVLAPSGSPPGKGASNLPRAAHIAALRYFVIV